MLQKLSALFMKSVKMNLDFIHVSSTHGEDVLFCYCFDAIAIILSLT